MTKSTKPPRHTSRSDEDRRFAAKDDTKKKGATKPPRKTREDAPGNHTKLVEGKRHHVTYR